MRIPRGLWTSRLRWWLLAFAWLVLLVLGVGGFAQQSRELGRPKSAFDNLYFTLQLAALNYGAASEAVNWRLQVVRFVAPVMAAGTVLASASRVFRDQLAVLRLGFVRDHTVVVGLGAAGVRLVGSLRAAGRNVVAITPDPSSAGVISVRRQGVPAIVGDPREPEVLVAAGVPRAARIVALSEDDATNVAVAATAAGLRRSVSTALRCAVHLADAELTALLRPSELGGAKTAKMEFFNLHERAARSLVAEHLRTDGATAPHLVVLGIGQLGRSVVLAAASQVDAAKGRPLAVTLVDRAASGRYQALRLRNPGLAQVLEVRCVDLDFEAPSERAVDELDAVLTAHRPSLIAVVFDDESLALSSGLFVRRSVPDPTCAVVVRVESDGGLGRILGVAGRSDLTPFPFLARACTAELVEGGLREQLARAIHEDHVSRVTSGGATHGAWEGLSDSERESSRRAADGIVERLAAVGRALVPIRRLGEAAASLSEEEVDRLAAAEHLRWMDERAAAGWRWGPTRDNEERLNPLLRPWEELDEPVRESNRAATRALPTMLARAGFEIA
jgi:voltage-gated potassium channel Kch